MKLFNRLYLAAFLIAVVLCYTMLGKGVSDKTLFIALFLVALATIAGIVIASLTLLSPNVRHYRIISQMCLYVAVNMTYVIGFYVKADMTENLGAQPYAVALFCAGAAISFVLDYRQHRPATLKD